MQKQKQQQQQQQQGRRRSSRTASLEASKKISNTFATRRDTRKKYRKLQEDVKVNRQKYTDPNNKALGKAIAASSELIKVVDSSRECVLDGEFLHALSTLSNESIQNLDTANKSWKPDDFAPRVSEFVLSLRPGVPVPEVNERFGLSHRGDDDDDDDNSGSDDDDDDNNGSRGKRASLAQWAMFGRSLLKGWKTVPVFDVTTSTLSLGSESSGASNDKQKPAQPAKPKATRLGKHALGELEKPDDVTEICETTETETSKRVMEVFGCVKKAYAANGGRPVSLWRFILNPDSYGQTIENLFYVSFLVKDGTVGFELAKPIGDDDEEESDSNSLLMILPKNKPDKDKPVRRVQNVLNMDWKTWRKCVDRYGAAPPLIPPRVSISHDEHINSFSSSANLKRTSSSQSSSYGGSQSSQSMLSSQHKRKKQKT